MCVLHFLCTRTLHAWSTFRGQGSLRLKPQGLLISYCRQDLHINHEKAQTCVGSVCAGETAREGPRPRTGLWGASMSCSPKAPSADSTKLWKRHCQGHSRVAPNTVNFQVTDGSQGGQQSVGVRNGVLESRVQRLAWPQTQQPHLGWPNGLQVCYMSHKDDNRS